MLLEKKNIKKIEDLILHKSKIIFLNDLALEIKKKTVIKKNKPN
jgi:hypothetical protein